MSNPSTTLIGLIYSCKYSDEKAIEDIKRFLDDLNDEESKLCLLNTLADDFGITPLMGACLRLNDELVDILVERGSDVNMTDRSGNPTLFYALMEKLFDKSDTRIKRRVNIVKSLLRCGADANSANVEDGETALMKASKNCSPECVMALCQAGARLDSRAGGGSGYTALMSSVLCGNVGIAKTLINQDANIFIRDNKGRTAIEQMNFAKHEQPLNVLMITTYLKHFYRFFKNSTCQQIHAIVDEFIRDPIEFDDESFPIRECYLAALRPLCNQAHIKFNRACIDCLWFLPYFSTSDFQEKLWVDVIFRLSDDNVQLDDGESLLGKRIRAVNKPEFDILNGMAKRIHEKCQLAIEIYETFETAKRNILEQINNLLNKKRLPIEYRVQLEKYSEHLNKVF